ncbi:protein quiver-like [Mya arenaria]|nr:protein quiver-like [Mya arenaria]
MANFVIGFVVLVGLVTLFSVDEVFAVKCYSCNSLTKSGCKDPFKKDGIDELECPSGCMKVGGKDDKGNQVISRSCSPMKSNKCEEQTVAGIKGTVCFCEKALCNSAERHFRPWVMVAGVASIIAVLRVF